MLWLICGMRLLHAQQPEAKPHRDERVEEDAEKVGVELTAREVVGHTECVGSAEGGAQRPGHLEDRHAEEEVVEAAKNPRAAAVHRVGEEQPSSGDGPFTIGG